MDKGCFTSNFYRKEVILNFSEKNSWNQLFNNFFSETLLSRNFCQACVRVNFENFHTVLSKLCKTTFFHGFMSFAICLDLINFLKVHNIFRKCATKKKRSDPIEDLPFPTIASIHQTLLRHPLLPKYGVQTYRSILKSMGFQ